MVAKRYALIAVCIGSFGLGILISCGTLRRQGQDVSAFSSVPIKLQVDPKAIDDPGAIANAAARVEPSVVTIDTAGRPRMTYGDLFGMGTDGAQREVPLGTGSGVILTADGIIVTNNHVIRNATRINVTLQNGKSLEGQVLGADPQSDLAVVKVNAQDLPAATLADSDHLRVGEWVVAVGDPLRVGTTVTAGIISAIHRGDPSASSETSLSSYVQTDAAINPGNSGGALADIKGRLIGINTAIASPNGSNIGIGFAIPVNRVRDLVPLIIAHKRVARPWLGVGFSPIADSVRGQLDIPASVQGILVVDVYESGPAAQSGIHQYDVVESINGKPITSAADLKQIMVDAKVGDALRLRIWRDGSEADTVLTLEERPAPPSEG